MSIQVLPDILGLGDAFSSMGQTFERAGERRKQQTFTREQADAASQRKRDELEAQQMRQQESGTLLNKILGQAGPPSSMEDILNIGSQFVSQGGDPTVLQSILKQATGFGQAQPKSAFAAQTPEELSALFQRFGMSEDTAARYADLYSNLTTGGQTAFAQQLMEQIQRGNLKGGLFADEDTYDEVTTDPSGKGENVEVQEEEVDLTVPDPFAQLTPKEKFTRQGELFSENSKIFKETQEKLKGFKTAGNSIKQLSNLNKGDKLPKGIGKALNVNWKTGDLRLPSAANPQTQLFVKTVNEFIKGAKDSFGARVTNFELDRFLQQLPTLANTEEGRTLILKQMNTVNKLNQLESDSIKEVYNHHGLRYVDFQQADQLAEKLRAPKEAKLLEKFFEIPRSQERLLAKEQAPKGQIAIEMNGEFGYIPESQRSLVKQKGGKIL